MRDIRIEAGREVEGESDREDEETLKTEYE
jgi:hypothetical protein